MRDRITPPHDETTDDEPGGALSLALGVALVILAGLGLLGLTLIVVVCSGAALALLTIFAQALGWA